MIRKIPAFRLFKEKGRSLRLNDAAEARLLSVAEQPLKDIIPVMRDTGLRNGANCTRCASRTSTSTPEQSPSRIPRPIRERGQYP